MDLSNIMTLTFDLVKIMTPIVSLSLQGSSFIVLYDSLITVI